MGCGACGRGSSPRTREAPGADRAVLWPLCEELAGLGPLQWISSEVREVRQAWSRRVKTQAKTGAETRKRGPGDRKAAVARREAPHFPQGRCALAKRLRRLARHSLDLCEGRRKSDGAPAPQRTGAMMRVHSSFRGANGMSKPGIQSQAQCPLFWIRGPARARRPGMTKNCCQSRPLRRRYPTFVARKRTPRLDTFIPPD
jgi:hypothetical protein